MATEPRRGGAKGLSGQATKKRTFFVASLIRNGRKQKTNIGKNIQRGTKNL